MQSLGVQREAGSLIQTSAYTQLNVLRLTPFGSGSMLSEGEITDLVLEMREGSEEAFGRLVSEFRPVVRKMVNRYRKNNEDLLSAGTLALVKAIRCYPVGGELGFGIKRSVVSFVAFAVRKEHIWLCTGRKYSDPLKFSLPEIRSVEEDHQVSHLQAKELLDAIAKDQLDLMVVEGKLDGLNNQEISQRTGLSKSKITRLLQEMELRAREFLREKAPVPFTNQHRDVG